MNRSGRPTRTGSYHVSPRRNIMTISSSPAPLNNTSAPRASGPGHPPVTAPPAKPKRYCCAACKLLAELAITPTQAVGRGVRR